MVVSPYHLYSHVLMEWENEVNGGIFRRLAQRRSVVRFDGRGTGLSRRDRLEFTLEARMADLSAVFATAVDEPAALIGMGTWGIVAVRFAAGNPEKVSHLILYDATPAVPHADDIPGDVMTKALTNALAGGDIEYLARTWASTMGADADWFAEYTKAATTAEDFRKARTIQLDCYDFLPLVRCPTLVIHELWPGEHTRPSQEMAGLIPNAELCVIERTVGDPWNDFADFSAEVYAFLGLPAPEKAKASSSPDVVTIFFTDLVGHTEMMSRLGDEHGREVLREHERITREVLKAHGGTEVKTMGDGFMASFGSVTRAVECASALQKAFTEREGEPLSVRVGLNAGGPIEEEGDLFGATVTLASRIAAKADGDEILVSDNVRSLCSGKGFLFTDRGEFVAKGFEEPVRVYEVRWQGQ
jgi:class 3 adenylate cyclase